MTIDDFTEISSHFIYLKKEAESEDDFVDNFLSSVLVDTKEYSDMHDLKLNKLINNLLNLYPVLFHEVREKKKREDRQAKIITRDKKLREIFIEEISDSDFSAAVDTLWKKKELSVQDDELLLKLNQLINTDLSYSDLLNHLKEDIKQYEDNKKIKIKELAEYLRDEIILRIADNKNLPEELYEEEIAFIKQEKGFMHRQLISELNQGFQPYEIWDRY